jgi:hypothetical protein
VTDDRIELLVRAALHDAADRLELAPTPELAPVVAHGGAHRPRRRALVAALAVVVIVGAGVVVVNVSREESPGERVTSPASAEPQGEVAPEDIGPGSADIQVFMKVDATPEQVAAIHALLAGTADVRAFAFLDQIAAYDEFQKAFACNPDLLGSVEPKDLPASFRVLTADAAATERLTQEVEIAPGVESVQSPRRAHGSGRPQDPHERECPT